MVRKLLLIMLSFSLEESGNLNSSVAACYFGLFLTICEEKYISNMGKGKSRESRVCSFSLL